MMLTLKTEQETIQEEGWGQVVRPQADLYGTCTKCTQTLGVCACSWRESTAVYPLCQGWVIEIRVKNHWLYIH